MIIPYYEEIEHDKKSFPIRIKSFDNRFARPIHKVLLDQNSTLQKKENLTIQAMRNWGESDEAIEEKLKNKILLSNESDPLLEVNSRTEYPEMYATIFDTTPAKIVSNPQNIYTGKILSSYILPNGELFQQVGNHTETYVTREVNECENIICKEKKKLNAHISNPLNYENDDEFFSTPIDDEFSETPGIDTSNTPQIDVYSNSDMPKEIEYLERIKKRINNSLSLHNFFMGTFFDENLNTHLFTPSYLSFIEKMYRKRLDSNPTDKIKILKCCEENYARYIKDNDIGFEDVRSCINYTPTGNNLNYYERGTDDCAHLYSGEGSYSKNLKQLVMSLAVAKAYIYDYYYRLCLGAGNIGELRNALNTLNKTFNFDFGIAKLVCMIGFDKIEKQRIGTYHSLESNDCYRKTNPNYLILRNIISTSRKTIYEPFFNYLLLGYEVVQLPKVEYNRNTGEFEIIPFDDTFEYGKEREYKEYLKEIKSNVKPEDRYKYII